MAYLRFDGGHDHARCSRAVYIGKFYAVYLAECGGKPNAERIAERVAAPVEKYIHTVGVDNHDVGSSGPVEIGQKYLRRRYCVAPCRRIAEQYFFPETPVAQIGPALHTAAADKHSVLKTVAEHIGKFDKRARRVFAGHRELPAYRNSDRIVKSLCSFREVVPQSSAGKDRYIGKAVAVEIDHVLARAGKIKRV